MFAISSTSTTSYVYELIDVIEVGDCDLSWEVTTHVSSFYTLSRPFWQVRNRRKKRVNLSAVGVTREHDNWGVCLRLFAQLIRIQDPEKGPHTDRFEEIVPAPRPDHQFEGYVVGAFAGAEFRVKW